MDPVTFFNKANELMVKIRQLQIRKCLKNTVNVGPGMEIFLIGDRAKSWKKQLQNLGKAVKDRMKFSKKLGQWSYFAPRRLNQNIYRAHGVAGFGANTVEVALYAKTTGCGWKSGSDRREVIYPSRKLSQVLQYDLCAYGDDESIN